MKPNPSPLLQSPARYEQPILKTMPLREQPAYRITQDPTACNLTELMAAVIGGQKQIELSQALLARFDGDIRRLFQAHPSELAKVRGINQATAVRIKAALNLGLRLSLPADERPLINSPADAAALVQSEMALLEKEHLRTILLDRRNRVLEIVEVYQGSVSSSQVRVGEVFQPAVARHPVNCASARDDREPDSIALSLMCLRHPIVVIDPDACQENNLVFPHSSFTQKTFHITLAM
jgi:DNA repair protein RadC